MGKRLIGKATDLAKAIMGFKLKEGMVALDATVGNGNDTLELARKVGENGKVYGFDIQKIAIDSTRELLIKNKMEDRVYLIEDSHHNLLKYIDEKIDFAIFNLGYLPKGDHSIITRPDTTITAVKKVLHNLRKNGILIVVVYYGHSGGEEEKYALENYLEKIDQKIFSVLKLNFINQINNPPFLFCIEKIN